MKLWEGFPSPFNSPNEILLRVLHPIINQQKMCPEVTTCFEKLKSIAEEGRPEEGQFYERKDNGGCDAHSKQTLCSQIWTASTFAFYYSGCFKYQLSLRLYLCKFSTSNNNIFLSTANGRGGYFTGQWTDSFYFLPDYFVRAGLLNDFYAVRICRCVI